MKSKGILFLFFFFSLFALQGQSVSVWQGGNTTWTSGAGTQVDPYLIESADHLAYLASQTNSGTTYSGTYFKMAVDIDLNGLNWTPIGNSSTYSFQGNFDGDNHTIYQLNIMVSGGSNVYVGLFGYLSNANISKIKIKGGVINVATSGANYVGTIAGYASATNIDSCGNSANILINNQGTTSAYNSYVGGLVGYMTGDAGNLSNSYNKGELNFTKTLQTTSSTSYSWSSYIGGLVGYLQYSDILNCGNLNKLTIMNDVTTYTKNSRVYVGGVTGYVNASATYPVVIDKTYNRGKLVVNNKAYSSSSYYAYAYAYIGGVVGYHQTGYISITNCYNRGDIEPYVYSHNGSYSQSYNYVGGISGYLAATTATYTNCYHSGSVPATYTPYNQDAGSGSKTYQHGCYAYNPSTVSPTITNCYFQNDCGCSVNSSPYASPLAAFILQSQGMPSTLGLTNWSQDINPRRNGGYPILLGGVYPDLLETLPVTDTTSVSAKLYAIVDVLQVLPENCSEMGFEYKLQGTATYTSINCALDDTFSVVLGGLLSCTTYTVRPYLTIDAYKVYGDTLNFTTLCLGTASIDTTRCYGDTLHIFGEDFYPDGTYYKIHNNTTYTIDFSYHPARHLTLDTIMDDGDTLFINNQPYTTSGVYVARFSPDGHGCDSIVYLSLRLRYYTPSVWDGMATPWSFGDGTAQNPYLIENAAQLAYMSSEINNNAGAYIGAYFDLVADIDLNGINWTPIGTSANQFQGYFNGNDHTIDNLNISINGNSPQYVGLFGYVSNGEISNVHIIGEGTISVRGTSTTFYIGSIAGYANSSTIDSCSNQSNLIVNHTGTTTSYNTYLGGLVGYLTGNTSPAPGSLSYLTNSMNQGKINFNITFESSTSSSYSWRHYIGGIAGRTDYATIENCGNLDSLFLMNDVATYSKNSYIYAGGITGYVYGTSALPVNIKKSYNKGKIVLNNLAKTTDNSYSANARGYIGGITGYCNTGYITISDCYNRGNLEPNAYSYSSSYSNYSYNYVGGISGYLTTSTITITNCYNTGNVPSTYTAYAGYAGTGTIAYYHDCIGYNASTYTQTNNVHYLNSCGCTNNATNSSPAAELILKASGMPITLNSGTPGSGIWRQDVAFINDGYPIFANGNYPTRIITLPAEDITSLSARLIGKVNSFVTPMSAVSEMGFEYKLLGTTSYTAVTTNIADSFSTIVSNLSPCSTYTYRAFVKVNQVTYYGDTMNVTLMCDPVIQIDTTLCYGDTLTFLGREFSPAGWYYLTNNDTTYAINLQYFASRINSIYAEIEYGDSYIVNGVPYTTSGIYQAVFDTDANGCDSVVNLSLRVVHSTPSVWDGTTTPWVFGDGTAQNPYLIENAAQLAYMSSEINSNAGAYIGAYFDLVADIDLNGINWAPIGTSANQFQGYFNGNDHTINDLNITINGNNPQYVGLFGYVSNGGISNVHIIGDGTISVRGTSTTFYIGSIAGYAISSTIDSCSNQSDFIVDHKGTTTSYNTYLGGLVGYLTGNTSPAPGSLSYLTSSMNQGKINFNITFESSTSSSYYWRHYIGGIAGRTDYATLENCGNLDSMFLMNDVATYSKNSYIYAGGITGYVYGTSALPVNIKKSYNKGKIVLNNKATCYTSSYSAYAYGYIGGITGYCNTGYITISDCYNRGNLQPNAYSYSSSYSNYSYNYVGGISGYLTTSTTTITNCYNTGNVPSTYTAYAGYAGTGTIAYYHDCIGYNASTYTQTNNVHYLNSCGCTNNATNSSPAAEFIFKASGMPIVLNGGAPGSGIWGQDVAFINDGYPIFANGNYPTRIITLPAEDITSLSARLIGKVNSLITPMSAVSEMGFEYKLVGTTHYTTVTANVADSFSTIVSNLSPCSTYTYRAFVTINQVTYYGDTLNFTLTSDPIIQIDTTICYGDTLTFLGREFSPAGWYYLTNNDTTYAINLQYFASRINSIYAEIEYGDSYIVNGVPYTTSGIYQAVFDTDANGCDSVVNLTLRVVYTAPSVWDGTSTPWVFGDGTAQNPYLIENAAQLAYMSSEINSNAGAYIGAYFDLVADIDLNGYNWAPIGTSANQFQGHFNGNDHTINDLNITVNGNNPQYVGLFGYVNNAEISNVHIIGNGTISVQGTNTTFYIGSIAGYANSSTIDSCSNQSNLIVNHTGTTTSYNTYLGGLVGYLKGNTNPPTSLSYLTNSMNQGRINFNITFESSTSSSYSWYHYIGGVVGSTRYATIENCGNLDSLFLMNDVAAYYKSSYIYAGGITGYVYGTSTLPVNIKKSYNKGKIVLNNKATCNSTSYYANAYGYIGGITGYCNTGYITISDCYNRGALEPNAYSYSSSYSNYSYNYVGGISGYLTTSTTTITNCYNTGNVPSTYTPYGGNAGTGTIYYYHDCIGYNASTYTQTNNNYYLSTCECTVNATNAAATQMLTMKDPGMPVILNQGAPGSGIWQQDITIINDGYPVFAGGIYPSRITTLPAENITSVSAQLTGKVNTNITSLTSISQIGFEYKLLGETTYSVVTTSIADSFVKVVGNLLPCSTYTYRAFVVVNNVTYYGDTVDFTLPCYPTTQIDTVICYGDTFSFLGQNYSPAGWYYTVNNNITYILNVQYYAARENTIYAEIEYGDSYWVNGVAYTASGRYHIQFAPDAHGCDSTVNLTLRVVHTSPSVWDGTATPWVFGDGTAQMPYQIENASQLAYMASEINSNADAYAGDYFELVADIDLNGHNWAPIGNSSTNPFQGYFDGNNHFINDLNITVSGNNPQYIGLFGYISQGEVSNVHITGNGLINVSTTNTTLYIGSIAGYAFSSIIDNCSNETDFNINNTGTTTIYNTFLGGIVGYVTGDLNVVPRVQSFVTNSLNKGKVNFSIALQYTSTSSRTWFNYIGGVAGACYYSVIENCGNIDSLVLMNNVNTYYNSSYIYSGGIAGYVYSTSTLTSTVKKGYNKGKIILNNLARSTGSGSSYYAYAYAYIGGITGYCNTGYTTITDCYNRGDLEPNAYSYHSSYYNRSYNYVGGITGYLVYSTTTITNCYNTGKVPSTYRPYLGNPGTGTIYYYHDCIGYNASTYTQTNNNYYLDTCGCTNNQTTATSLPALTLQDPSMPTALNQGSPGSGIWKRDIFPYINDKYPMFNGGVYPLLVKTLPPLSVTNVSANFVGTIDTTTISLGDISSVGFRYRIDGTSSYQTVGAVVSDTFSINVGGLTACTTYVYQAFIVAGGNTVYGNEQRFSTNCLRYIDTTICYGESFALHGQTFSNPGNYQLTVGNYTYYINLHHFPHTEDTVTITICQGQVCTYNGHVYTQPGYYNNVIAGTTPYGCDSIVTLHILQSNDTPPVVSISGGTTPECAGTEVNITANGALSYQWSTGETTDAIIGIAGQRYTVYGTDGTGCSSSATITLPTKPSPDVQINGDTLVCQGSNTVLTATGATSYEWSTGAFTDVISVTPSVRETYWVRGAYEGCYDSVSITIDVLPIPTITVQGDTVICEGEQTMLVANGANSYRWSTEDETPSIIISPTETTIYTVTGSNSIGCNGLKTVTVTVNQTARHGFMVTTGEPYTWNGQTYVTSGIYTQTFTRPGQCDSIVTLNLTITSTDPILVSDTVCRNDVYTDFGFYIVTSDSTPGTYTYVKSIGNTSIELSLTILASSGSLISQTICKGGVYNQHGFTIDSDTLSVGNHLFYKNYPIPGECDSVVTLDLTVVEGYSTDLYDTVCYGTPYYSRSGITILGLRDSLPGNCLHHQPFTTALGCDSIVTLHLFLSPPNIIQLYDTICVGSNYVRAPFTLFTEDSLPGNYLYIRSRTMGDCIDTLYLHLTILPIVHLSPVVTICDGESYSGYGFNNLTTAGSHQTTLSEGHGCDTVVELTLIVNPIYNDTIAASICKGGVYGDYGFVVRTSTLSPGTYYYTKNLLSSQGCDSVVVLALTVNPILTTTIQADICKGTPYLENGFGIATDALSLGLHTFTRNLYTVDGCDSVVTLELTVNPSYTTVLYDTIVQGDVYTQHGFSGLTAPGTYVQTLLTQHGCDSVITLHLSVLSSNTITLLDTVCQGDTYSAYGFNIVTTDSFPGTYTYTTMLSNMQLSLQLTVLASGSSELSGAICKGGVYNQHGFTIDSDTLSVGNHRFYKNYPVHGECDSVVTLNLTVAEPYSTHLYDTLCYGKAYYNRHGFGVFGLNDSLPGNYQYVRPCTTTLGCDSIVTLHLFLSPPNIIQLYDTICVGSNYERYPFTLFTRDSLPGNYLYSRPQTMGGCTDTLYLHLTILPIVHLTPVVTICEGGSYSGYGFNNLTTAGSHQTTLSEGHGCDTVVELTLIINPIYNDTIATSICKGGVFSDYGFVVRTSTLSAGTYYYTQNLLSSQGCDSVVVLALTVNPILTTTIQADICKGTPYLENGFGIATNTLNLGLHTFTRNLYTVDGCDSVVTLELTVNPSYATVLYDTIIQGDVYTQNGFSGLTVAGTYVLSLTTQQGCDSVITLHLCVLSSNTITLLDTVCQGDTYSSYGFNIETTDSFPGTYTYTTTLSDMQLSLQLTVLASGRSEFTSSICKGGFYNDHGFTIDSDTLDAGTYRFVKVYTVNDQCDSVVTLNLTVVEPYTTHLYDTVCFGTLQYTSHEFTIVGLNDSLPGNYQYHRQCTTALGCDSIVTLHLFLSPPNITQLYDTICAGNDYADYGFALTMHDSLPGDYFFGRSQTMGNDCIDSFYLHLTILPIVHLTPVVTICEGGSYSGYGFNHLTTGGTYRDTLPEGHGCDTLVELTLIVNPIYNDTIAASICKGGVYADNGFVIRTSTLSAGTYYYTRNLLSSHGCDSIVVLAFRVNPPLTDTIVADICKGTPYLENGFGIATDTLSVGLHTYTRNLYTVDGCDSVVTLKLTVNPSYATVLFDTIVQGDVYTQHGFSGLTVAGTYVQTLPTQQGCDSVLTLHLCVLSSNVITLLDTVCQGDTYSAYGFNIVTTDSSSGTYIYTTMLLNMQLSLQLTVLASGSSELSASICKGGVYNQHGFTIDSDTLDAGTHRFIKAYAVNDKCDSIVTLNLTVIPAYSTHLYDTLCYGKSYYNRHGFGIFGLDDSLPGNYQFLRQLQTSSGCDSTITLHLFLSPPNITQLYDTICFGNDYIGNGFTLITRNFSVGDYFYTRSQTIGGCIDSIYLHLTIMPIIHLSPVATICEGEGYSGYGFNNLTTAGTHQTTLPAANGCDTIVELTLIVNPIYNDTIAASICKGGVYSDYGFVVRTSTLSAGTYYYRRDLSSSQGCDSVVVLALTVNPILTTTIQADICKGTPYLANGFGIATDALSVGLHTFTRNLYTVDGCDSTVTLQLTVNPTFITDLSAAVCQGAVYSDYGFNIATTNLTIGTHNFTQNLTSSIGCDSTVRLTLTVNPTFTTDLSAAVCQGVIYSDYGFNIETTNLTIGTHNFTQNLTSSAGCDSTVRLSLTVNPIITLNVTAAICAGDSYSGYGFNNLTTAGTHQTTLPAANGCDTTVELTLIVNPIHNDTIAASICKGGVYSDYGFVVRTSTLSAGTYYYRRDLSSSQGCDSVVVLALTVNPILTTTIQADICKGTPYFANGFGIATDALSVGLHTFTRNLYTVDGCDSTVTLQLTVNPTFITDLSAAVCQGAVYSDYGFNIATTNLTIGTHNFTQNLTSSIGCDSTVRLSLTVNPTFTTDLSAAVCQGVIYSDYGFNIETTNLTIGTHNFTQNLTSSAGCDSTVRLSLTVNPIITLNVTAAICAGDSYSGYGFNNLTTAGTHQTTLPAANGCDTTVELTLIVNPIYNDTIAASICKGGVYSDYGFVVRTSTLSAGTYYYRRDLSSSQGCDSVVVLALTVNPILTTTIQADICKGTPYLANGFGIATDALSVGLHTFTRNLYTVDGCDSTVTLQLTVNPTFITDLSAAVCQGAVYSDYGFNIATTNLTIGTHNFTQNLTSSIGCDSTVRLSLTVNPTFTTDLSAAVCQGVIYSDYGFNIETTNLTIGTHNFTQNLTSSAGCDSTVRLSLTVNPIITLNVTAAICAGDSYSGYGFNNLTTAGTHQTTLPAANGCDTTVELTLIVNPVHNDTIAASICKGGVYSDYGFVVRTSTLSAGTYYYRRDLSSSQGCDSVVVLALTVNPILATTIQADICKGTPYLANGFGIATDALSVGLHTFTRNLYTVDGCDSTVTLQLTVNPTFITNLSASVCQGAVYSDYGFNIATTNLTIGTHNFTQNLTSITGCDSTVRLTLTVNPTFTTDLSAAVCQGVIYSDHGFNIETTNLTIGTHNFTQNLTSSAGCDSTVRLSLTVNPIITLNVTVAICAGDSYSGYGFNNLTTAGTHQTTLPAANACDTTVELTLIVNPIYNDTIAASICKGGVYSDYGFVVRTSTLSAGTYYYRRDLLSSQGCDSAVVLALTVNPILTTTIQADICKGTPYLANGFGIATDALSVGLHTFTRNLYTVDGCDSTVTLQLTVNPTFITDLSAAVCQGAVYSDYGFNIATTNLTIGTHNFTQNLTSSIGCDSTVRLTLTVKPTFTTDLSAAVCQGAVYNDHGFNIETTNLTIGTHNFTQNLTSSAGCDSTVRLSLTVNPIITLNVTAAICAGDSYSGYGFNNLTTAGTHQTTLPAANGCDTIVELTLTVNPIYNDTIAASICKGGVYSDYGFVVRTSTLSAGTYYYRRDLLSSQGCDSAVVLALTVNPILTTTIQADICKGTPYLANGFGIATDALSVGLHTFTRNLYTVDGCDSTVTLQLTVNPISTTELSAAVCQGVIYSDYGFNIETANLTIGTHNFTQNLTGANGCDSIVNLALTISRSTTAHIYHSTCDSFTWFGTTYTSSGNYAKVLNNANDEGCDSVIILHLTIKQTTYANIYDTACNSYTWQLTGETFLTSGDYQAVLLNSQGCDSIITLHLTVNYTTSGEMYDTACVVYNWYLDGRDYTQSGDYEYTIIGGNSFGCDSVVTLHLLILENTESEFEVEFCEEYRWDLTSETYYTSGDYVAIIPNSVGCDSIITMHLTINQASNTSFTVITTRPYYWEVTDETYDTEGVYSHTYYGGASNGCDSTITLILIIENDTTDIQNIDYSSHIQVFPNPTRDEVYIKTDDNVLPFTEIEVYDIYGKFIMREKVTGDVSRISLQPYSAGVYLLRLIDDKQIIDIVKVIKQ